MSKKLFSILGIVFSALIVVSGVLVVFGVLGGDASGATSAPSKYDSGYASFGADFYSFVNNNAAEAAVAARFTASNVRSLCELLKNVCGIFLMGFGLMGVCFFGIQLVACKEAAKAAAPVAPAAPVPPTAPMTPNYGYAPQQQMPFNPPASQQNRYQ